MTKAQAAAYVQGQAACLMAEALGMQAENMVRASRGDSMAYGLQDFELAIERYCCHHNVATAIFEEATDD